MIGSNPATGNWRVEIATTRLRDLCTERLRSDRSYQTHIDDGFARQETGGYAVRSKHNELDIRSVGQHCDDDNCATRATSCVVSQATTPWSAVTMLWASDYAQNPVSALEHVLRHRTAYNAEAYQSYISPSGFLF